MLRRAQTKASHLFIEADLRQMDIQRLDFPDATFDTVIATLVFCSVADPVRGLSESFRVCKPDGKLLLLEHGISSSRTIAKFMNALECLVGRTGEHVNRRPESSTQIAGFRLDTVRTMALGIIRLIEAQKPVP
jgi:ubiquinone/menaquinone biosynthesis C-methylase UbiE